MMAMATVAILQYSYDVGGKTAQGSERATVTTHEKKFSLSHYMEQTM